MYAYDYRGLMVMVVSWLWWAGQKTLWNCGSIVGCIIFFIVKIISTLCLLLTGFINFPVLCFCGLAREPNELAQDF